MWCAHTNVDLKKKMVEFPDPCCKSKTNYHIRKLDAAEPLTNSCAKDNFRVYWTCD